MDYQQTVDYLFTQTTVFQRDGASAYKPGLDTALLLSEAFGNPHKQLRTIHVAGTNGKGSTAHTIAAICRSAGLRTGLYTSPHLTDFRERIRVDGEMIPREAVTDFVRRYMQHPELMERRPSFFELTTIMAFEHFARERVDVAVIEVGLGGRLDTTNIITPEVSIITNISLDHTGLLGNSVAEIAAEKAGIIKPGVPVVTGPDMHPEAMEVIARRAGELHAPLHPARPVECSKQPDGRWLYNGEIHGELRGDFQPLNAATVLTALSAAAIPEITPEAIAAGFSRVEELTGLRGRLTDLHGAPCRVTYDTGHNPGAWIHIARELRSVKAPRRIAVIGFAADKDVESIVAMLPQDYTYVFTRPDCPRGLPAEQLAAMAAARCIVGEAVPTVAQAYARALTLVGSPDDFIFVGGSNFVVADFLNSL